MRLVAQALGTAKISDSPFGLSRFTAEQITSGAVVLDAHAARAVSFDMALGGGESCLVAGRRRRKNVLRNCNAICSLNLQSEGDSPPPPAILIVEPYAKTTSWSPPLPRTLVRQSPPVIPTRDEFKMGSLPNTFLLRVCAVEVRRELVARLSPDRMLARRELEKLALLAGSQDAITAEQVFLAVADNAESDFDDLCFAITAGQVQEVHESFTRLTEGGAHAVAIARIVSRHLLRLSEVVAALAEGAEEKTALRRLSPPVFWKREAAFRSACKNCAPTSLSQAVRTLLASEAEMKSRGASYASASLERALLSVARQFRQTSRR